jgi:hypothetical protein
MPPQDERLGRLHEALSRLEHRLDQAEQRVERCAGEVTHLDSTIRSGVERNGLLNGLLDMLPDASVDLDAGPNSVRKKLAALVSESGFPGEPVPGQPRKRPANWKVDEDDVAAVKAEVVRGEPGADSAALMDALARFFGEH